MYKLEFSHVFVLFFICYAAYWVSCCISGKFVVAYTVVCAYPTNVSVPGLSGACDTCDIGRPPDDLCTGISVTETRLRPENSTSHIVFVCKSSFFSRDTYNGSGYEEMTVCWFCPNEIRIPGVSSQSLYFFIFGNSPAFRTRILFSSPAWNSVVVCSRSETIRFIIVFFRTGVGIADS
jgi:hypothetical protein